MDWCRHFKWRDDFCDFTYEVELTNYRLTGAAKIIEIRPVDKSWMVCPYDGIKRPG